MKIRYKTEHGCLVAKLPDDHPVDSSTILEAAKFLDQLGTESNAGQVKVTYRRLTDNSIVGVLTWRPDEEPKP